MVYHSLMLYCTSDGTLPNLSSLNESSMMIIFQMFFNCLPADVRLENFDGTVLAMRMASPRVVWKSESGIRILDVESFKYFVKGGRGLMSPLELNTNIIETYKEELVLLVNIQRECRNTVLWSWTNAFRNCGMNIFERLQSNLFVTKIIDGPNLGLVGQIISAISKEAFFARGFQVLVC
jgi:hypothetical protein